jgi:hypothetical protein
MVANAGLSGQTCSNCGMESPGHERFCIECGTHLPDMGSPSFSPWRLVARILLVTLAIAAGVVMGSTIPLAAIFTSYGTSSTGIIGITAVFLVIPLTFVLSLALMIGFRVWAGWFLVSAMLVFIFELLLYWQLLEGAG